MKKVLFAILVFLLSITVSAQEKEKKEKTGWRFDGALPATTYDSNLGFQYGALVEFRNYGNPSVYPDFLDHTYTEISHFTKGSGIFRMMYESFRLIPGVHSTHDLSYLPDAATDFYGFNGYDAVYNRDWMKYDKETGPVDPYKSVMFYRLKRNQFRFKNDFQGKLIGEHIKWSAGFAINKFTVGSIDIDRLNKGRDVLLPDVTEEPGLYELYRDSLGIITADEAEGGWVNTLKAGIEWDSRDNRKNPMKGLWTETGFEVVPGFLGNNWSFTKYYITHRQYFTLVENDLSFVYRLGYQTTLGDSRVPFFYQSQIITSMLTGATNEGLGGNSTMRGVLRNRILGNGVAYGNFELRWKPVHFTLFNKEGYLGLNLFYDMGIVTKKIDLPADIETTFAANMKNYYYPDFFNPGSEKLHHDAGISIMPVWGNFVIAIDIGKSFNEQDGNIGFAIGLNYLF